MTQPNPFLRQQFPPTVGDRDRGKRSFMSQQPVKSVPSLQSLVEKWKVERPPDVVETHRKNAQRLQSLGYRDARGNPIDEETYINHEVAEWGLINKLKVDPKRIQNIISSVYPGMRSLQKEVTSTTTPISKQPMPDTEEKQDRGTYLDRTKRMFTPKAFQESPFLKTMGEGLDIYSKVFTRGAMELADKQAGPLLRQLERANVPGISGWEEYEPGRFWEEREEFREISGKDPLKSMEGFLEFLKYGESKQPDLPWGVRGALELLPQLIGSGTGAVTNLTAGAVKAGKIAATKKGPVKKAYLSAQKLFEAGAEGSKPLAAVEEGVARALGFAGRKSLLGLRKAYPEVERLLAGERGGAKFPGRKKVPDEDVIGKEVPPTAAPVEYILPTRVRDSLLRLRKAIDEGIEDYRTRGLRPATVGGIPEREIPSGWRAGVDPQLESMGMRRPLPIEDVPIDDVKLEMAQEALSERLGGIAEEMIKRGVKVPRTISNFAKTDVYGEIDAVQRANRGLHRPNIDDIKRSNALIYDAIARRHGGKSITDEFDILADVKPGEAGDRLNLNRFAADWDELGQPEEGIRASKDAMKVLEEVEELLYKPVAPVVGETPAIIGTKPPIAPTVGPVSSAGFLDRTSQKLREQVGDIGQQIRQPFGKRGEPRVLPWEGTRVLETPTSRTEITLGRKPSLLEQASQQIRQSFGAGRGKPPPKTTSGGEIIQTPGERLMPEINISKELEIAFDPTKARELAEKVIEFSKSRDIPGIEFFLRLGNPSLYRDSVLSRVGIARMRLRVSGKQWADRLMSHVRAVGTQDEVFGRTDLATGKFVDGPFIGRSMNEIAENPSKFKLTERMEEWLKRTQTVEEAKFQYMKESGIKIERIPVGEREMVERYANRIVVGRYAKDGELLEVRFVGPKGSTRLKGLTPQEQKRAYSTVEAAQKDRFVVMPYEHALEVSSIAVINRVVDKRIAEYILKNLPENVKFRTTEVSKETRKVEKLAKSALDSIDNVIKVANAAINNRSISGSTLKSIRYNNLELAEQLDRAFAINIKEFDRAIGGFSKDILRNLIVNRKAFREALDAVLIKAGKAGRLNARNITPGDLTAALKIMGKDQRISSKMLTEVYKNAFAIKTARRNDILNRVKNSATRNRVGLEKKYIAAKKKTKIESEKRKKVGPIERRVDIPGMENRILTGEGAPQFKRDFEEMMKSPEANEFLRRVAELNAVQRILVLAGDVSQFWIQFQAALYTHPQAIFHSAKAFAETFAKAILDPSEARRLQHIRIDKRRPFYNEHPNLVISSSGLEATEALAKGGVLEQRAVLGTGWRGRVGAIPGKLAIPLKPFQMAYESGMDEAGYHIAKGLESLAKGDPKKMSIVDDYVNNIRGLISSEKLGVSTNQRLLESSILLAARYRRAVAALYVSALQGGIRGDLARKAFLHLGVGILFTYSAITIGLGITGGKSRKQILDELIDGVDPRHSRFLLWRMGGQLVGPGSKFVSDFRLMGKMAVTVADPLGEDNLLDLDEFQENDGVRWARAQLAGVPKTAWDVFIGSDYMGEPTAITDPSTWARMLGDWTVPLWVQGVIFDGGTPEERMTRGTAEFIGLRTFPQSASDILIDQSFDIMGKPYEKTETFEREILREVLKGDLIPLQESLAERGSEIASYFSELDKINEDRIAKLLELSRKKYSWLKYKSIEDYARGQRANAGIDQEFEESNPEDEDPLKAALAQRNQLFGNPNLRSDAGTLLPEFRIEMEKLIASWTPEQADYVARNINRRPIPRSIFDNLPRDLKADIGNSQRKREEALIQRGREDLARISNRFFFLDEEVPESLTPGLAELKPPTFEKFEKPIYGRMRGFK